MKRYSTRNTSSDIKNLVNPVHPAFKKKTRFGTKLNTTKTSSKEIETYNDNNNFIRHNNASKKFIGTSKSPIKNASFNTHTSSRNKTQSSRSITKTYESPKQNQANETKRDTGKKFVEHISEQDEDFSYSTMFAKKTLNLTQSKANLNSGKTDEDKTDIFEDPIISDYNTTLTKINDKISSSNLSYNLNGSLNFQNRYQKDYKKSEGISKSNEEQFQFESMVIDESIVIKNKPRNKQITDKIDQSFSNKNKDSFNKYNNSNKAKINNDKISLDTSEIFETNEKPSFELKIMNIKLDLPRVSEQNIDLETTNRNRSGYDNIENYIVQPIKISDDTQFGGNTIKSNVNNKIESSNINKKSKETPGVVYYDPNNKRFSDTESFSDLSPNPKDIIESEEKYQALLAKYNELQNEDSTKNNTIKELTNKNKVSDIIISENNKKIYELNNKLLKSTEKLTNLQAKEQSFDELTSKTNELEKEIKSHKENLQSKDTEINNIKIDYDDQIVKLQKDIEEKNLELVEQQDCMDNELKDGVKSETQDYEVSDLKDRISCLEVENDNLKYTVSDKFQKIKEFMGFLEDKDREMLEQCTQLEKGDHENKMLKEILTEKCQELAESKRVITKDQDSN